MSAEQQAGDYFDTPMAELRYILTKYREHGFVDKAYEQGGIRFVSLNEAPAHKKNLWDSLPDSIVANKKVPAGVLKVTMMSWLSEASAFQPSCNAEGAQTLETILHNCKTLREAYLQLLSKPKLPFAPALEIIVKDITKELATQTVQILSRTSYSDLTEQQCIRMIEQKQARGKLFQLLSASRTLHPVGAYLVVETGSSQAIDKTIIELGGYSTREIPDVMVARMIQHLAIETEREQLDRYRVSKVHLEEEES